MYDQIDKDFETFYKSYYKIFNLNSHWYPFSEFQVNYL